MEHDSLDWAIIIILLLIMIAPIAGCFLFTVWLIKKVYQRITDMINSNNERYCYIAYKHNQTGQIFDSGIQLETEIDQTENNVISSGHCILIRYNTKEVEKLKGWIQTFRNENNVIC